MIKYLLIALSLFILGNNDPLKSKIEEAFEFFSVSNFEEAAITFEEAFTTLNKVKRKDINALMRVSFYTALSYREINDYQASKLWLDRALMYAEIIQDKKTLPKIYALLGDVEIYNSNFKGANNQYHKALLYELSDKDKAALLYSLAESYRLLKDYTLARQFCDQSKELATMLKFDKIILSCDIIEADILRNNEEYAKSLQLFSSCQDRARGRGYTDISIMALSGKGLVAEKLERQDIARANFEEALALSLKNNKFNGIEPLIKKIEELMPAEAKLTRQAMELFELINNNVRLASEPIRIDLWNLLALYYTVSGELSELPFVYEASYADAITFDDNDSAVKSLIKLADIANMQDDYKAAKGHLDEAVERNNTLKNHPYLEEIKKMLSIIENQPDI